MATLIEALKSTTNAQAHVCLLPEARKEDERALQRAEGDGVLPYTPVSAISGDSAMREVLAGLGRFYGNDALSTRFVYRLPGVVVLPYPSADDLIPLITQVNQAKADFKALVDSIEGRDQKFELVHAACKMLVTLQLTRKLQSVNVGDLKSVGFSWSRKPGVDKLSIEEGVKKLQTLLEKSPKRFDANWAALREEELANLSRLKNGWLEVRRTLRPKPVCNIRSLTGEQIQKDAYLPVLAFSNKAPIIRPLKDYDPAARKGDRGSPIQRTLISNDLKLYFRNK